jgi:hypothetical protein
MRDRDLKWLAVIAGLVILYLGLRLLGIFLGAHGIDIEWKRP